MAYTTIDKPSDYFETKLWSGNATDDRAISGLDFAPNWVWIKNRTDSNSHAIFDTVRGATKYIESDTTDAEATGATFLKSFTSDGFTLGTAGRVNANSQNYVAWNWLAGGSASSNTDGSITSSVSANTTSGFSIVSYTGNGTLGATVGHGLGSAPSMVLVKRRNTTGNWWSYHSGLGGADKYIVLNSTSAVGTSTNIWNNTAPTSNVFSLADNANFPEVNGTSNTFIAYCFAEKKGYSKFGSYVGNGSTSGTYVHLGFKPAWVMIKGTSIAEHWWIFDNKRSSSGGNNVVNSGLVPSLSNTEYSNNATFKLDLLSNGFKLKDGDGAQNGSGHTYIYACFASNPFVTSSGVPACAR